MIYLEDKIVEMVQVSPDEKFVLYEIAKNTNPKKTIVPNYVTTSGFTEDINARTKVGEPVASSELYIYDIARDTVFNVNTDHIPGITDAPTYSRENSKVEKHRNTSHKFFSRQLVRQRRILRSHHTLVGF